MWNAFGDGLEKIDLWNNCFIINIQELKNRKYYLIGILQSFLNAKSW
jgi:hypothetical protein